MQITPLGDTAIVIYVRDRFDDAPEETIQAVLRVQKCLEAARLPGVTDIIPAYTTVAVFYDPVCVSEITGESDNVFELLAKRIRAELSEDARPLKPISSRLMQILVCYDKKFGLDLDHVAQHAGLTVEQVVSLHLSADYQIGCIGFTPGFPYLIGLPRKLATPRRPTPRNRIPPGSVAIGGTQTGIYPVPSPGGWNIIGRTPLALFNPQNDPPALLRTGDRVRLRQIDSAEFERHRTSFAKVSHERLASAPAPTFATAKILRAGFLTTIQDLGRIGFRHAGVSVGGALDHHGFRVANLLVGNEESCAGLEITFGGLTMSFSDDRIVAWCGAQVEVRVGSKVLSAGHAARLKAGNELAFSRPQNGCRNWLAISGGIDVPILLRSRSTDLRAQFGGLAGRALEDGDELSLGPHGERSESLLRRLATDSIAAWKPPHDWVSVATRSPVLRVLVNRELEQAKFGDQQLLFDQPFTVSATSDRMGVRLDGPPMPSQGAADLISEAVAPGTIQLLPSGQLILLLGDCQTIGGYPKIAHVVNVDLPAAAQLCGGDHVVFRKLSLRKAHELILERQQQLEQFRCGLELQLS